MARGFLNHIWYKLLDEEGVPISGADVYIRELLGYPTEVVIYQSDGSTVITQPISTDANGVFEFYVKDHIKANAQGGYGYTWDTQYIIEWDKDDKSGLLRYDDLFGEFASVNISGSTTRLNKAISNFLGWTFEEHTNFMFGTTDRCGSSSSSSTSISSSSESSTSISSSSESSESSMSIACQEIFGYYEPTNEIDVGGQLITIRTRIPASEFSGDGAKFILIIENNNVANGDVTEMWIGRSDGGPSGANFNGGQQQVLVGGSGSFTLSGGGYKTLTDEITMNFLSGNDHVVSMYYNGDSPSNYWSGLPLVGCDVYTLIGSNEAGNTTFTGTLSGSNQIYGLNAICVTELPS